MGNVVPFQRRQARNLLRSFIRLIPDLVKLLYRLVTDARVSNADKALLLATIVYVLTPIDFMPDIFPFLGQVDDLYAVAIAVLRIINNTSKEIVNEHWDNPLDIKRIASAIVEVSHFFLPLSIRRVLTGRASSNVADFRPSKQ
ncbi:MAG: DUF1232 domain-containing protein [Acidobacteriota bacterium]|nr:DUF1232 domain-containing protein [Blastocatellia bacterium]MDW8413581.1 DUF1232 domain-containing protein [Acidobacteriota bacterium]